MAVRKAGNRWVVEFMFRGIRVFRRLPPGQGKQQAQALESKLRNQIFDSVDLGKLPDPPLERVIDEWLAERVSGSKSAKQTKGHARAVKDGLAGSPALSRLAAIRNELLAQWSDHAAGTINRRLCVLKSVGKYAFQKGYTHENLSAKIQLLPEKNYTRRDITPAQVQAVIDAANTPRARALIAFAAYTGMRLGEILKLAPEDVVGGFIRVRDAKTGDRDIPIPGVLKPHLGALPFKSGWRNIYRGWQSARKRAGVNIRFHDLRHFAATQMANAGKHPIIIADILGHKSLQTTRKYTHPSMEAKAKAMGAITAKLHQGGKKRAPE